MWCISLSNCCCSFHFFNSAETYGPWKCWCSWPEKSRQIDISAEVYTLRRFFSNCVSLQIRELAKAIICLHFLAIWWKDRQTNFSASYTWHTWQNSSNTRFIWLLLLFQKLETVPQFKCAFWNVNSLTCVLFFNHFVEAATAVHYYWFAPYALYFLLFS